MSGSASPRLRVFLPVDSAKIPPADQVAALCLSRSDPQVREDLLVCAACLECLEANYPAAAVVMRHVATAQTLLLAAATAETWARTLCATHAGLYHIDGRGWFNADGELLLPDDEPE